MNLLHFIQTYFPRFHSDWLSDQPLFYSFKHREPPVSVDPLVPAVQRVPTVTLAALESLVCLVQE